MRFLFPTEDDLLKEIKTYVLDKSEKEMDELRLTREFLYSSYLQELYRNFHKSNIDDKSGDELAKLGDFFINKSKRCCFYFYCLSAKLKCGHGLWGLGRCYLNRFVVSRCGSKILDLFEQSANEKFIGGYVELAKYYFYGCLKASNGDKLYKTVKNAETALVYSQLALTYFKKDKLTSVERELYEEMLMFI